MATSAPMARALALARQANHSTSPNPMVGAVLVRDGRIVGEGYHERAGEAHAEIVALQAAGAAAAGSSMYVTLEPCAHEGRTGPCAVAVAEAGVQRVVAALEDPDPRTAGQGLALLVRAGVEVASGDGADEAERLNSRWLAARRAGRAYCALKFAMSLDGKIATTTGESRWITSDGARAEAHRLRRAYSAVAVGARTVSVDNPRLTAREADGSESERQPLRIVVDGRLSVGADAAIFDQLVPGAVLVATGRGALEGAAPLRERGVRVEGLGDGEHVDPAELLRFLLGAGVDSLLVEGGGELAWAAVEAGVVDHVYAFIAPILVGGAGAPTPLGGLGFGELADALRLEIVSSRSLAPDLLVEAVPV